MFCGHFFLEMAVCPAVCRVLRRAISADFAKIRVYTGVGVELNSRGFVGPSGGSDSRAQFSSSEGVSVLCILLAVFLVGFSMPGSKICHHS